jgi:cytidylate kinase
MSGGAALAERVASALGCPCLGREILVDAASRLGVPEAVLAEKLEHGPGLWERLTLERRIYAVAMQAALAELVTSGELVYHGYAGHLLLRGLPAVLRVRLIAPMAMRVRAEMERLGLTQEVAEARIRARDEGRLAWTRAVYGVDLRDPALYDLVVNLEGLSLARASATVIEAARQPELLVTAEARERLADFALECRVKVAFAMHPASRGLDLAVRAANGQVTVMGEVPEPMIVARSSTRWQSELKGIARDVPGVRRVELDIRPFDAYH